MLLRLPFNVYNCDDIVVEVEIFKRDSLSESCYAILGWVGNSICSYVKFLESWAFHNSSLNRTFSLHKRTLQKNAKLLAVKH